MTRRTLTILALLAAAFLVATVLAVRQGVLRAPESASVAIGGPFHLVDQTGAPVDQDMLKGKWSAVFFGFTFCPDVCPTALFSMGQVEPLLGARARDLQTVFVSVDPGRDTPAKVAAYVATPGFPKAIRGLTGDEAQVAGAAKAYRAYYQKTGAGPDYQVSHSSIIYLMNPKGRFACPISSELPPAEIARKIKAAMAQGAGATSC